MIVATVFALITLIGDSHVPQVKTPPMGWNSYDCFNYAVTEQQVLDNAKYMESNLKKFGWKYVVVDYVWSSPDVALNVPNQDANFNPRLAMDSYGRLTPDLTRFPSAKEGKGFTNLAAEIHRMGLKFGIHLMRGIPKQAVAAKCPVEGNSIWTAVEAANQNSTCSWLNHMFGLNMQNGAGQAYLDSIFRLYASWGVDFVKVDDLSQPYSAAEIEGYHLAIQRSKRPMILSLSPGETPIDRGDHVAKHADMWRLLGDFWDNWSEVEHAFTVAALWNPIRGRGAWPDLDMLPFGKLRKHGPSTGPEETFSRFTHDELQTVMTLWCITQSPLMLGGNLPENDSFTTGLLRNAQVLAVDQYGSNPKVEQDGQVTIWSADAPSKSGHVVAIFNRDSKERSYEFDLSRWGPNKFVVRDLWFSITYASTYVLRGTLRPHACRLLWVR